MADVSPPVTSAPSSTTAFSDESTLLTSVPLATSAEITASVVKEEPEGIVKIHLCYRAQT